MQRIFKYSCFTVYLLFITVHLFAGTYLGRVIDVYSKLPVSGANVTIMNNGKAVSTDMFGQFSITSSINTEENDNFNFRITNNTFFWNTNEPCHIQIINTTGYSTGFKLLVTKSGSVRLPNYPSGIYFLIAKTSKNTKTYKLLNNSYITGFLNCNSASISKPLKSLSASVDTIVITKDGYNRQQFAIINENSDYEILKDHYSEINYLDKLLIPEAFNMLSSEPFNPTFGEVKSIKVIYSIKENEIYFANSAKYFIHYDFAADALNYNKGHSAFNKEQYSKNPNRLYFLGTLNHFTASDKYVIEFFPSDELDCSDIETIFNKITQTTYIGNKLKFYSNTTKWNNCNNIPQVSSDELFTGQNYQPLTIEEGYGYLLKVDVTQLNTTFVGRHNIVILNGIPMDISVVAGIITTEFQTPLSHINVLSHNRGTPNMALRNGWTNTKLTPLENKLVHLKVTLDSFSIREASLVEAQEFWSKKEPHGEKNLARDTITTGLIDLSKVGINSVKTIGGKAANYAELLKITTKDGALPVPEGAFAIPAFYYWQHLKRYGLDEFINNMLVNPTFWSDLSLRAATLEKLQDSIKHCQVDINLINLVNSKLVNNDGFTNFRFRSSTNAEDIEGFNGAGLYDSFTGIIGDKDKTIEKAIRKTWASAWNLRAFEEREYFKINHREIVMGVLVHRSFPAEEANGVVITKNMYNIYNLAYTINVQVGEVSIVKPTENYLPDQIICYLFGTQEYVSHSNVPGMENKTVMTEQELNTLVEYCKAIQNHYCTLNLECKTLDIEFKIDKIGGVRKLYIKQARLY